MKNSKIRTLVTALTVIAAILGSLLLYYRRSMYSNIRVMPLRSVNSKIQATLPVLISKDYESHPEKGNPHPKKPYMSYIPEIYDPNINYEDIAEHLTNESPNAFTDPYISQKARFYNGEPYNYKLVNAEYAAKYYSTGIGFGDYLYTEGFSFMIEQEHIHMTYDIVKSTSEEFNSFIEEMTEKYSFIDIEENPGSDSITCSFTDNKTRFDILYNYETELLIQRTFFNK